MHHHAIVAFRMDWETARQLAARAFSLSGARSRLGNLECMQPSTMATVSIRYQRIVVEIQAQASVVPIGITQSAPVKVVFRGLDINIVSAHDKLSDGIIRIWRPNQDPVNGSPPRQAQPKLLTARRALYHREACAWVDHVLESEQGRPLRGAARRRLLFGRDATSQTKVDVKHLNAIKQSFTTLEQQPGYDKGRFLYHDKPMWIMRLDLSKWSSANPTTSTITGLKLINDSETYGLIAVGSLYRGRYPSHLATESRSRGLTFSSSATPTAYYMARYAFIDHREAWS
ncbi:hypothetical protein M422DRAFT_254835 [Sphaerobolus stellatus SS14]|uniref:Uncharacterized protein n=1 Tax=Sphaerobolus stellatus (strain SS14) TaxID=990650 RepID=A0A0C9VV32_SPHS4|nr:hypothetical protein M422DRAFT_254835 [Sphaerobolus stellatus SS14]